MALTVEFLNIDNDIKNYVDAVNKRSEGETDLTKLNQIHAEEMRKMLTSTCQRIRVTIPSGLVVVQGFGYQGTPIVCSNPSPIVIEKGVD